MRDQGEEEERKGKRGQERNATCGRWHFEGVREGDLDSSAGEKQRAVGEELPGSDHTSPRSQPLHLRLPAHCTSRVSAA